MGTPRKLLYMVRLSVVNCGPMRPYTCMDQYDSVCNASGEGWNGI